MDVELRSPTGTCRRVDRSLQIYPRPSNKHRSSSRRPSPPSIRPPSALGCLPPGRSSPNAAPAGPSGSFALPAAPGDRSRLDYRDYIDCAFAALGQLSPFSETSKLPCWIESFVLGFEKLS